MSTTEIDGLLDKLVHDDGFRSEFETDRDQVLRRFSLSEEQHEAMRSLDVGGLMSATEAAARPCPPAAIV